MFTGNYSISTYLPKCVPAMMCFLLLSRHSFSFLIIKCGIVLFHKKKKEVNKLQKKYPEYLGCADEICNFPCLKKLTKNVK